MARRHWQCSFCSKVFLSRKGYTYHERIHSGIKPYKCDICKTAYTGLSSLKYHNKKYHQKDQPIKVQQNENISRQVQLTSSKLNFPRNVNSKSELPKVNRSKRLYKCTVCSRSFSQLGNAQRHETIHVKRNRSSYLSKPYKCRDCDKRYNTIYTLQRHQTTHTGKDTAGYKSNSRSRAVKRLSHLKPLKVTQVSSKKNSKFFSKKKFTSAVGKTFQKSVVVHEAVAQPMTTENSCNKCDVCDLGFASMNGLKRHKVMHNIETRLSVAFTSRSNVRSRGKYQVDEQLYQCEVCCNLYKSFLGYKYHIDTNGCEKAIRRSLGLTNQKASQPARHKPLECLICHKRFLSRGGLRIHQRAHTGDRPYKCNMCAKSYISSGGLKYHQTTHKTDKRYKESFYAAYDVHKNTHKKSKEHKCELCNKKFRFPGSLALHKIKHSSEKKNFKCELCSKTFEIRKEFEEHQLQHELEATEPSAVDYVCFQCNASFDLASNLVKHANDAHLQKK